jgi:hypothetical protein
MADLFELMIERSFRRRFARELEAHKKSLFAEILCAESYRLPASHKGKRSIFSEEGLASQLEDVASLCSVLIDGSRWVSDYYGPRPWYVPRLSREELAEMEAYLHFASGAFRKVTDCIGHYRSAGTCDADPESLRLGLLRVGKRLGEVYASMAENESVAV